MFFCGLLLDRYVPDSVYYIYFYSNPTQQNTALELPCMTTFGAPNTPSLVLGGYEKDEYSKAKALIITFAVKNSANDKENEKAIKWEREFIRYLQEWEKSSAAANLSLAYSSESSVKDEIDKSSTNNVFIVLASYLVMFVYIIFGLGRFKSKSIILVSIILL